MMVPQRGYCLASGLSAHDARTVIALNDDDCVPLKRRGDRVDQAIEFVMQTLDLLLVEGVSHPAALCAVGEPCRNIAVIGPVEPLPRGPHTAVPVVLVREMRQQQVRKHRFSALGVRKVLRDFPQDGHAADRTQPVPVPSPRWYGYSSRPEPPSAAVVELAQERVRVGAVRVTC